MIPLRILFMGYTHYEGENLDYEVLTNKKTKTEPTGVLRKKNKKI